MRPLFLIVSTIYFSQKPLSYTKIRSLFNPEERVEQTLKTISSIRENIPHARIFLLETGNKNVSLFEKYVDIYKFIGNDSLVKFFINSPWKGLGEVVSLLSIRDFLRKEDYGYLLKISGRYFLNKDFSLNNLHEEKISFLKSSDGKSISTRLYGLPKKLINKYIKTLFLSIPFLLMNKSIEDCFLFLTLSKDIYFIKKLGVSGYVAPTGEFISE